MSDDSSRIVHDAAESAVGQDAREPIKRWLADWEYAGRVLDQERSDSLAAMTDADARQAAQQLFELWQPDWPTDEGEALLLQQRVFARAARRSRP